MKVPLKSITDWIRVFFCGICMGAADIVPGISGGTIAFIMGFYEDLIQSIKSVDLSAIRLLVAFRFGDFASRISWQFLAALISGIAFSFVLLASYFDYILGHEVYRIYLYSGFMGLILASVVLCALRVKAWKVKHLFVFFAGCLIAYLLTGGLVSVGEEIPGLDIVVPLSETQTLPLENYDPLNKRLLNVSEQTAAAMLAKGIVKPGQSAYSRAYQKEGVLQDFIPVHRYNTVFDWKLMVCGALAVSAMLLPGISGSYLLTILGVYAVVIGAIADFTHGMRHLTFDGDAFKILANIAAGVLIGGLCFSHFVSWLMQRHHDTAVALLTGFMVGAMQSVWPFWIYRYAVNPLKLEKGAQILPVEPFLPDFGSPLLAPAIMFGVLAFASVLAIEFAKMSRTKYLKL